MQFLSKSHQLHQRHRRKAKALLKPNLPYYWWRYVSNAKRTSLARSMSPEYSVSGQVAQELKQQGVVIGESNKFLSEEGRIALTEAAKLVMDICRTGEVADTIATGISGGKKSYKVDLVTRHQEYHPDSPLVRLALDKKLLEIVSQYLGLWPRLHAINAWLNFPTNDAPKQAQLWHRDGEDLKFLKVFIYLVDVDATRGPFSYVPQTQTFGARAAKRPKAKDINLITDEEMSATFPAESWVVCTGPAKTMILADTRGYHRGGRATGGNRVLISFTYTSGRPFAERWLRIKGQPTWPPAAIQKAALY